MNGLRAACLLTFVAAAAPTAVPAAGDAELLPEIIEEGDRQPEQTVVPAYPRVARRDRIEGDVKVCYFVDRKGRPRRIAVRSSSHRIFEKPAIRAVRASRYRPLAADVSLSGIKTCRTFRFRLRPVPEPAKNPQ